MKLAFWKDRPPRGAASRASGPASSAAGSGPDLEAGEDEGAAVQADLDHLRTRARRRLIGAAALLLLVVVLVPMLLDPTPRAVPDNIPIDLPSDRTPFTPKITPPPLGAAAEAPAAAADATPIPAAPGSAADAADVAGPAPAARPEAAPGSPGKAGEAKAGDGAKADAHHAPRKPDGRAEGGAARLYVQAAAFSKESAARDLAAKLGKSGLASFVERTESNGSTHFRVRLGPFATRDEAERAHARLHALGVTSNIISSGAGT